MSKKTANKNTPAKPAAKSAPAAKQSAHITAFKQKHIGNKPADPPAAPKADPPAPAPASIEQDYAIGAAKMSTKELQKALKTETNMKPALALAVRAELDKRQSAKPAAPKADPPAAEKPAAPDTLKLHLNNTGRLCFTKGAADRLKAAGVSEESVKAEKAHIAYTIEDGLIRFEFASAPAENTLKLRMGAGRPYVSATKQFKPLGFAPASGSNGLDIEAKPYGAAGFEFRLPL